MNFTYKASRYGKCVREMQVCQRLAPIAEDLERDSSKICCETDNNTRRCNSQIFTSTSKDVARGKWFKNNTARSIERMKESVGGEMRRRKDEGRKRRRPKNWQDNRKFEPQVGPFSGALPAVFTRLTAISGIPFDNNVLEKIENVCALYTIVRESISTTQMCGALFLYFKTLYRKSVAMTAAGYLAQLCDLAFSPQTGEFTPQSFGLTESEKPKWLSLLKECKDNWAMVIRNEGFTRLSKILSLALALGLCEASHLDFRISGIKLFSIGAQAKHASAVDLLDAVFETVSYFAEGGYACFQRGSIKPLLYGNMENEQFEENYGKCQQGVEYAKAGNLKLLDCDDNDFELLLCSTIEKCQTMIRTSRGPVEKNVMQRKLDMLRIWQTSFRQTRVQGGLRCAPYSIGVYGTTGVGKSSVANIMMITTLLHNGFCATDEHIITLNDTDKYMSNYRSYVNGILLDDIGNTKAEFTERAPSSLMIQLVNNVRTYANMAEADLKGKVSVEPKVVIATKNVKDTCATVYSNEPASIARRDRITLTVKVRDEFRSDGMLDFQKVNSYYNGSPPIIPDLWEITVEHAYPVKNKVVGKADLIGWKVINHNGVPLQGVSIHRLIRYVAEDSKRFYASQKILVDNQNNMAQKFRLCAKCSMVSEVCSCSPTVRCLSRLDDDCCTHGYCVRCEAQHDDESISDSIQKEKDGVLNVQIGEQIGAIFVAKMTEKIFSSRRKYRGLIDYWFNSVEEKSTDWIIQRLEWLETSPYAKWTNWIPTDWLDNDFCQSLIWTTYDGELQRRIKLAWRFQQAIALCIFILSLQVSWYLLLLWWFPMSACARVTNVEKQRLYEVIVNDNQAMPQIYKMYRDRHVKWITSTSAAIAAIYALVCLWKALRVIPTPQGNLAPTTEAEIVERDSEINPWAGVYVASMPASEKSRTTDVDILEKMVLKNLAHMVITYQGKKYHCDAFFPCSNVALVPAHMWKGADMHVRFTRHDPEKIGGNFEAWLCKKHSYDIPNTDLSLVWVPNGGDWKDLSEYFALADYTGVPARLVYKKSDGTQLRIQEKTPQMMLHSQVVQTFVGDYQGHTYNLNFNTFEGLCMSVIVTETRGPTIGGFHLSGVTGDTKGASGLLTKDQLCNALKCLKNRDCVVVSKSEGTIPTKLYDIQFYSGNDVHPKSAINYLPYNTNVRYYGQCTGRATYHTEVVPTVITEQVAKVTGVENKWAGPKFGVGYPFQASLQYSAKPSLGIEGSLLDWAVRDYGDHIVGRVNGIFRKLKKHIRPLERMENLCGIDGLRFIDKIPPHTSKGFPLSGPKSEHITRLDPNDYDGFQCPAELAPMYWDHAEKMEKAYLNGERAYAIFKACLKDEPTPIDKDKVRVFQGAPLAFQLLIRKYFLPIARVLSVLPFDSECAVGVNAQGPEWDQLARHVKRYGADRILAGDYSKYDLRMPAQVMFCAFRVLMDIARACGTYTDRDFIIMEGIATDVCYPLMAYNGDLIQHIGSNPSGQNLTVYINSIVNSLLFRCAFKSIVPATKLCPFRDACSLITYGDDAKSSVKAEFPEFNHLSVAKFLADHDMKFTMPDKTSTPTPYMRDEEADLLKRKNIFSVDTGMYMGALDEDSIFKSLHSVLRSSSITPEHQAMQNIDGALREWFLHGREVYERRREQMKEIAEEAQISHGCSMLSESYDDRLVDWRARYCQ